MKNLLICGIFAFFFAIPTQAQTQTKESGTVYKCNSWIDIKGNNGDLDKAMNNPKFENVKIFITEKNIYVTFGEKKYTYKIISKNKFSEVKMDYNVFLNGEYGIIAVADMGGTKAINYEGNWVVWKITDISEIK